MVIPYRIVHASAVIYLRSMYRKNSIVGHRTTMFILVTAYMISLFSWSYSNLRLVVTNINNVLMEGTKSCMIRPCIHVSHSVFANYSMYLNLYIGNRISWIDIFLHKKHGDFLPQVQLIDCAVAITTPIMIHWEPKAPKVVRIYFLNPKSSCDSVSSIT